MMDTPEPSISSVSELGSLSDSDWLDIDSSRASEDNDSLAAFEDSDREDNDGRPSSRRSFASVSSSKEAVVERWEGIVEDSADESPLDPNDMSINTVSTLSAEDLPEEAPPPDATEADEEEERVKAGLEQSMMSTLSASRSNSLSASVQTSIIRSSRDLRLSFPDPLTSSRDELLNTSFEDLVPSADNTSSQPSLVGAARCASPTADPAKFAVMETTRQKYTGIDHNDVPSGVSPDFSIVVYGLSSFAKSPLIDTLLDKWAIGAGLIPSCTLTHAPRVTTRVYISDQGCPEKQSRRTVSIIDKTGVNCGEDSVELFQSTCPSIAILCLPTFSQMSLSDHTLYLPIAMPSPLAMVNIFSSDHLLEAEQQWETFGIPAQKLSGFSTPSSPVIDHEKLDEASPSQVFNALKPLTSLVQKKSWGLTHAISLAFLSLVLGSAVLGSMGPSHSVQSPGVPVIPVRPSTLSFNKSGMGLGVTLASVPFTNAVASSCSKAFDIAIFNPPAAGAGPSSSYPIVATSASSSDTMATKGPNPPSECSCGCGLVTVSGKSQDVLVRPVPITSALSAFPRVESSLSLIAPTPLTSAKGKGKAISDVSFYSISTRLAGTIVDYFDLSKVAVKLEVQELIDALDQLAFAIGRQMAIVKDQYRTALSVVKQEFIDRNTRARKNAKRIREMGERFIFTVGEKLREKTEVAKENARSARERIAKQAETKKEGKTKRKEAMKVRQMKRKETKDKRKETKKIPSLFFTTRRYH
ncbi:hypothetical protein ABKN59_002559 [Abortiporus biennis]